MNTQILLSLINLELNANVGCRTHRARHSILNLNDWTDLHGFRASLKSPPMWRHRGSENTSVSSGIA